MKIPKIVENDSYLKAFTDVINKRSNNISTKERLLTGGKKSLKDFATGHLYYGLHKTSSEWILREWAPNATEVYMVGDFSNWEVKKEFLLQKLEHGNWEIKLSHNQIGQGDLYKLFIKWNHGSAFRLPSYGKRMVQDPVTKIFSAEVYAMEKDFQWKCKNFKPQFNHPFIYEAHVGMATEEERVGTYLEFKEKMLPRIKKLGYNTIQLMAIQEHPYYGSFGYHVSNFFAVSSRFGTPDELKSLIDAAHLEGIAVIMDLVHSHSVKNDEEGLAFFDGTPYQYFHDGYRRHHVAWDSLCFNYSKNEVLHFLLSNCQYWLEEYNFDGFRFDGVTSMIYLDHGLGRDFNDYRFYFDGSQDEDALTYLGLANKLIHEVKSHAISIAEEVSGMPGLASPIEWGGIGFDFRMAMGMPDFWIKILKEQKDDQWNVSQIYYEASSHRADEKVISYCESHDQALVGDKTIAFRLMDKEMYFAMAKNAPNVEIDRGIALHKIIRLVTAGAGGGGYLTFMGNEFGHPEWIDFPREGNGWSYKYARRQWNLCDNIELRYQFLNDFDADLIALISSEKIYDKAFPYKMHENIKDQVLGFERNGLFFIINFNPHTSFPDYKIAMEAGKYCIVLNSDSEKYGGFKRVDESIDYYTMNEGVINGLAGNYLNLYLPNRTALVLKKQKVKSIY